MTLIAAALVTAAVLVLAAGVAFGHHGNPVPQGPGSQAKVVRGYTVMYAKAKWLTHVHAGRQAVLHGRARDGRKSHTLVRKEYLRLWEALHPGPLRRHRAWLEEKRQSPRASTWYAMAKCECSTWRCATGNGYYGGLQMDVSFMQAYGADMIRKYGGYAHLWSVRDQMIVADRAVDSGRGFYPWPACARRLGLIG